MSPGDRRFVAVLLAALAVCYAGLGDCFPLDASLVTRNPAVADAARLTDAFLGPHPPARHVTEPTYAYRPVAELSFRLNLLASPSPLGLRLGNLAIHAAAALAALYLVRAVGRSAGLDLGRAGRWASLLIAVHPFATQSMTYVYQRYVLLEAALGWGACLLYLSTRAVDRPWRRPAYWGAWLLTLLATGSKETAVTLPLCLAALEHLLPPEGGSRWRRWLPFTAPSLGLAFQLLRAQNLRVEVGLPGLLAESSLGTWTYAAHQLSILPGYLLQSAWPFPLAFHYDRPPDPPGTGALLLGGACLAALLGWILLGPARHRLPRLALALFLAPLALESSVFPILDTAWDYRIIPCLAGAAILFGTAAARRPALAVVAMVLMAFLTRSENRRWAFPAALLERDVRHAWHVTSAWSRYGSVHMDAGRTPRALPAFRRACLSPWYDARVCEGYIKALKAVGKRDSARAFLAEILAQYPRDLQLLNLAIVFSTEESNAEALDRLERRVETLPSLSPKLLSWRVRRMAARREWDAADALLVSYESRYGGFPFLWIERGNMAWLSGRLEDAEGAFARALAMDPTHPQVGPMLARIRALRASQETLDKPGIGR